MDNSLFVKHIIQIKKQKEKKDEISQIVEDVTGVVVDQSEYSVSKKEIIFQTSSVKRSVFIKKGLIEALKEKGYTCRI